MFQAIRQPFSDYYQRLSDNILQTVAKSADYMNDYYQRLPDNIFQTVAKSAGYTFAIAVVFSRRNPDLTVNMGGVLLHSGIAALASTIHALLTPLFNKTFGTQELNIMHEWTKNCITASLTSCLVAFTTTSQVHLAAFRLFSLISSNVFEFFYKKYERELDDKGNEVPLSFIKNNPTYINFYF